MLCIITSIAYKGFLRLTDMRTWARISLYIWSVLWV